ncbi:hypothetical protein PYCC9005_005459 [Savitreella phatthalungensis]
MVTHYVRSEEEACRLVPEVGDKVRQWTHTYVWTRDHRLPSELAPMRTQTDTLADEVVLELGLNPGDDAFEAISQATGPSSRKLWDQMRTVPDWLDVAACARGQDVFYRYAGPAFTGLLFDSLFGGYGARRISEVLVRTGSFGVRSARRRLLQTTQWELDVLESLESLLPPGVTYTDRGGVARVSEGGEGWKSSVRVRVLHAQVRARMLARCEKDPSYYDVEENGVPINQLHQLVTLCSFSSTLIDHAFPMMGVTLTRRERDDYIHVWRYIAYLLGADDTYFVSADKAKALLLSIVLAEVWPAKTEAGKVPPARILLDNSIAALAHEPPSYLTPAYIRAHMVYLHGRDYCREALHMTDEELALFPSYSGEEDRGAVGTPLVARAAVVAKISFFFLMDLLGKFVPGVDSRRMVRVRRLLRKVIVDGDKEGGALGGRATIALEWVPGLLTEHSPYKSGGKSGRSRDGGIVGIEKHYVTALVVVVSVASIGIYSACRGLYALGKVFV